MPCKIGSLGRGGGGTWYMYSGCGIAAWVLSNPGCVERLKRVGGLRDCCEMVEGCDE